MFSVNSYDLKQRNAEYKSKTNFHSRQSLNNFSCGYRNLPFDKFSECNILTKTASQRTLTWKHSIVNWLLNAEQNNTRCQISHVNWVELCYQARIMSAPGLTGHPWAWRRKLTIWWDTITLRKKKIKVMEYKNDKFLCTHLSKHKLMKHIILIIVETHKHTFVQATVFTEIL